MLVRLVKVRLVLAGMVWLINLAEGVNESGWIGVVTLERS
jgi:hypothetical protein